MIDGSGYAIVYLPGHPRAQANGCVKEHRLIVERILGHALPKKAVIHHVNEIRDDNRPCNLVVLANHSEHTSLHYRLGLLRAGANPWTEAICGHCRSIKPLDQFNATSTWCRACNTLYQRARYGHKPQSEYHPHSKLSTEDVLQIRLAVAAGEQQRRVAARFHISRAAVCNLIAGRTYRTISEETA